MAVSHEFPASAAKPLVEGYCEDFVTLAASLAQTLEQIEMRNLGLEPCREVLQRTEKGMRGLADAIHDMLARSLAAKNAPPPEPEPAVAAPKTATGRIPDRVPARQAAAAPEPIAAPTPNLPKPMPPKTVTPGALRAWPEERPDQLKGTNQSMPMLSVMQFLNRTRKSGTLHVGIGDEHVTFDFVQGLIEASSDSETRDDERLGDLLLAMYPGQRDLIVDALDRISKRPNVRRLGNELVKLGAVSNGQIIEALERQTLLRYRRVAAATDARYVFEEGERVPGDGRIQLRPFELDFACRDLK